MSNHSMYPIIAESGSSDQAGYSPSQVNIMEHDEDPDADSENEFWKTELKSLSGKQEEIIP